MGITHPMKMTKQRNPDNAVLNRRWPWILTIGCLFFLVLMIFRPAKPGSDTEAVRYAKSAEAVGINRDVRSSRIQASSARAPRRLPEEVVSEKVQQFARNHEAIVAAIAKKLNVT